ncbi:MAG: chromosomal replication initiator protein DnaA [Chloroflexi bacterium]|nr:chromosomal replication initiator protein DnaA [Chloroflexota bacterium]
MLSPNDAWHATLGQLQLQLNRATFDTWLKGSELVSYEEGEFLIRVRHAYAKDWLEQHLNHLITHTLGGIFGRSVRINYVVHLPNQQRTLQPAGPGPLWAGTTPDSLPDMDEPDAGPVEQPKPVIPAASDLLRDYSEWDPRITDVRGTPTSDPDELPLEALPLDRRYTFESFVTGPANQFARAAAQSVAAQPGGAFNPLYIYGHTGLGKTHLLQAIGHQCTDAGLKVAYITAEAFTNEMVRAIRSRETEAFRARYRQVDVLLVDDIQFLAGKSATEEEFYHTFNAIYAHGGQIVVTCDRQPRAISGLDDRLRSRFEGGLVVDIQAPAEETRRAILKAKAAAQQITLPDDVADLLARQPINSVREIEGVLLQVLARATLTAQPVSIGLAQLVLDKMSLQPRRTTDLSHVLEATAKYHQLSLDDLMSKRRTKAIVRARHIAMYLAREETEATLPQIGAALGGRNHSTVLHGYQKIADEVAGDDDLRREVSDIRRQLYVQN